MLCVFTLRSGYLAGFHSLFVALQQIMDGLQNGIDQSINQPTNKQTNRQQTSVFSTKSESGAKVALIKTNRAIPIYPGVPTGLCRRASSVTSAARPKSASFSKLSGSDDSHSKFSGYVWRV